MKCYWLIVFCEYNLNNKNKNNKKTLTYSFSFWCHPTYKHVLQHFTCMWSCLKIFDQAPKKNKYIPKKLTSILSAEKENFLWIPIKGLLKLYNATIGMYHLKIKRKYNIITHLAIKSLYSWDHLSGFFMEGDLLLKL